VRARLAAEEIISGYGLTEPKDIDVEAISMDLGMLVEYDDIQGCEATLVGLKDKAIATVRRSSSRGRERFSVSHELGHWMLHRGKSFRCRMDAIEENLESNKTREREADEFSAHLLMPAPLFNPQVRALGMPGFRQLEELANNFQTSLVATVVRMVNIDTLPILLASYGVDRKLRWHLRANHVPPYWTPNTTLDEDSFSYEVATHGGPDCRGGKQPADAVFSNDNADDFEIHEYAKPNGDFGILSLIYLGSNMLDDSFDWRQKSRYEKRY